MRIGSATEPPAASAAFTEAEVWAAIADRWRADEHPVIWRDLPPIEAEVIPDADPRSDLERRARRWSYPLRDGDLADLARFAAALAQTEGGAWQETDRILATQTFEERRFLMADRILPWAVPWLRAAARCFPEVRSGAEAAVSDLLDIGERHRPAPALSGAEGLFPPGYDSYGPADLPSDLGARIVSLWGGLVVFRRSIESVTGGRQDTRSMPEEWRDGSETVATWYEVTSIRWRNLAKRYPGTARLWDELAERARRTAESAK
ncbi:MAG: hypothetical protein QNJ81_04585 [Acidimicrobiia bacterium]|nr:hypothetical protein [Acidimicrobiia bacterium]